jgi:hypothetical protein
MWMGGSLITRGLIAVGLQGLFESFVGNLVDLLHQNSWKIHGDFWSFCCSFAELSREFINKRFH